MKTIKYLALVALVALMGATLTSCGGYSNGKAKDMIVKSNDGKLEEDDYATMIEWVQDARDRYLDEWESVIEDNKDDYQQYEFAFKEMDAEMDAEYIFYDDIVSIINRASYDEKKIGKENKENWEKYCSKVEDRESALRKKAPRRK